MRLFFVIICIWLPVEGFTKTNGFLILGKPSSPFKISADPNHPKPGISMEILRRIMIDMEVPFQFQLIRSVARIEEQARKGRAEMLISFSKKEERKEFLVYPNNYYRFINWNFFIRAEDARKIRYQKFEDLKPYKIGVARGVSYTKEFWKTQAFLEFFLVAKEELLFPMLLSKRVDIIPMSTQSALVKIKNEGIHNAVTYLPKAFKSKPYYDVIVKNSPYFQPTDGNAQTREQVIEEFVNRFDRTLKALIDSGFVKQLYEKYDQVWIQGNYTH